MTSTAHALVGAAIATRIGDPVLSGSLIISSHFLLDIIPHWDFGTNWKGRSKQATGALAIADTVFAFLVVFVLFQNLLPLEWLILAPVLANLPDWMEAPWYIFYARADKTKPGKGAGLIERLSYSIYRIENIFHTKADKPFGVITTVGVVVFFLLLLI